MSLSLSHLSLSASFSRFQITTSMTDMTTTTTTTTMSHVGKGTKRKRDELENCNNEMSLLNDDGIMRMVIAIERPPRRTTAGRLVVNKVLLPFSDVESYFNARQNMIRTSISN